jgi:hypothetical protein
MKVVKSCSVMLASALLAIAGSAIPALAVTNNGAQTATPYVAAFAPIFGTSGVPHSGTMRLVVRDGAISGTYTGTSVAPDLLDDRIVPISGSLNEHDGYVQLYIGGVLSLRGTMANDGRISGTATYRGRLYEFVAAPGTLGRGA